jgi:poly(hydroxyalkanoate) depolymerase family esterase
MTMKFSLPYPMRQQTLLPRHARPLSPSALMRRVGHGVTMPLDLTRLLEPLASRPSAGFALPDTADVPPRADARGDGGQFVTRTFSNPVGSRHYKLYIPSGYRGQPVPLIVMLHGCTQSPDDFAAGTRMNAAAEAHACLVAYPGQPASANMQKCWNWFNPSDQQRDGGEPSIIAGITREIMRSHTIDPARVFVAGLSAGGACAAIMGDAYPDLYAAIGVHSGLACGAAQDMPSAFTAMQRGTDGSVRPNRTRVVPAIVFHGERDSTVNPRNGAAVAAQAIADVPVWTRIEAGQIPGGHAYTTTRHLTRTGTVVAETWVVHGAGHAWSGGSPDGSYTDPRGPDATAEMMRFFLAHPH